jgi:hypothetical protein
MTGCGRNDGAKAEIGSWQRDSAVERARKAAAADPEDAAAASSMASTAAVQGEWKSAWNCSPRAAIQNYAAAGKISPDRRRNSRLASSATPVRDRADKELENFYARAHYWYKQVRIGTETDDVARFQQRIEQIEARSLPPHLLADDASSSLDQRLPSHASLTPIARNRIDRCGGAHPAMFARQDRKKLTNPIRALGFRWLARSCALGPRS